MTMETLGKKWVYVDAEKESADLYIVNHTRPDNIVVTQDIGLAGLLLKKNVMVLTPRGKHYTEQNIDTALQFRYLSAKGRREGIHSKGPKPFLDADRKNFADSLEKILSKLAGIES